MFLPSFMENKKIAFLLAGLLLVTVARLGWRTAAEIPFGFLYLLPMLMVGRFLKLWQILVMAALCTYLAEQFDPLRWNIRMGIPRDVLYFAAFAVVGIFATIYQDNLERLRKVESQKGGGAEDYWRVLVESSPAATISDEISSHETSVSEEERARQMLMKKLYAAIQFRFDPPSAAETALWDKSLWITVSVALWPS